MHIFRSFLQVGFSSQYQLINLVWLSIDFYPFSWSQPRPQSYFKKLKTSFSPSSYSEKMCWGQSLTICFFVALYSCVCSCPKISQNNFYLELFTILVFILQSTCFISTYWKRKQTMEQQPHRACEWTKSKQKQSHATFKLTLRSIVRFSPQTMP